jgi:hypothetical protein
MFAMQRTLFSVQLKYRLPYLSIRAKFTKHLMFTPSDGWEWDESIIPPVVSLYFERELMNNKL